MSPRDRQPPPVVSTDDRRDMESVLQLDESTLDPSFNYRWVKDEPQRIARHKMKGYVVVSQDEGVRTMIELDQASDGVVRIGDTILMKCPRARYEERQRQNDLLTNARLQTNDQEVRRRAAKHGVRVITDPS